MNKYFMTKGLILSIGFVFCQSMVAEKLNCQINDAAKKIVSDYYKTVSPNPTQDFMAALNCSSDIESTAFAALLPSFFTVVAAEAQRPGYFWGKRNRSYEKSDWWKALSKSTEDFLTYLYVINSVNARSLSGIVVEATNAYITYKLGDKTLKMESISFFKRHWGKLVLAGVLTAAVGYYYRKPISGAYEGVADFVSDKYARGRRAYQEYRNPELYKQRKEEEAKKDRILKKEKEIEHSIDQAVEQVKQFGRVAKQQVQESVEFVGQKASERGADQAWEQAKQFGRKAKQKVQEGAKFVGQKASEYFTAAGNMALQKADEYLGESDLRRRQLAALRGGASAEDIAKMDVDYGATKRRIDQAKEKIQGNAEFVGYKASEYGNKALKQVDKSLEESDFPWKRTKQFGRDVNQKAQPYFEAAQKGSRSRRRSRGWEFTE